MNHGAAESSGWDNPDYTVQKFLRTFCNMRRIYKAESKKAIFGFYTIKQQIKQHEF